MQLKSSEDRLVSEFMRILSRETVLRTLYDSSSRWANVTMGCGDACRVFPGELDWELPDPSGKPVDEVRRVRDDIDGRVRHLLAELVPA